MTTPQQGAERRVKHCRVHGAILSSDPLSLAPVCLSVVPPPGRSSVPARVVCAAVHSSLQLQHLLIRTYEPGLGYDQHPPSYQLASVFDVGFADPPAAEGGVTQTRQCHMRAVCSSCSFPRVLLQSNSSSLCALCALRLLCYVSCSLSAWPASSKSPHVTINS